MRLPFHFFRVAALVGAAMALLTESALAHDDFEITAGAGYRFPFGVDLALEDSGGGELEDGRLSFDGAFVFTGMAAYRIRRDGFIYLSYTRGVHDVDFEGDDEDVGFDFSTNSVVEYYQFGGIVEATRGIFVPYMGFSVGLGRVAPTGGGDSRLFFTPVFDPGIKIDVHEHIHLRLMGRVPLLLLNKDIVCVDSGCAHAPQISPTAQLELLGGLSVSF